MITAKTTDRKFDTPHTRMKSALDSIAKFGRVKSSEEIMQEINNAPEGKPYRLKCFPTLDTLLDGIFSDEFIVIHGSQGEGKTTLVLTMIDDLSNQGRVCYFYSLEESKKSIMRKYHNNPPSFFINDDMSYTVDLNKYPEEDRPQIKDLLKNYPSERMKLLYLDILELTIKGLKPQFVFIDYFHKLLPSVTRQGVDPYLQVSECLQTMVNTLSIVIVVINHDVKSSYDKKESSLADVRDSNWITSAARIVMSIKRPKNRIGEPEVFSYLKIEKHNREGGIIGKRVRLIINNRGLLSEMSREELNGGSSHYEQEEMRYGD